MDTRLMLLRWGQVIELTGLSKSTIKRRIKSGSFPSPLDLGGNCRAWKNKDIEVWINNLEKVNLEEVNNAT
jgi:prophage regulatory protein